MRALLFLLIVCAAPTAFAQKTTPDKTPSPAPISSLALPDDGDTAPDLVGRWRYELEAPDGGRPFGHLVFTRSAGVLKGQAIGFAESPLETIALDGAHLLLTFTPRGFSRVTMDAVVEGDTMTGTFSGTDPDSGPLTLPLTATRQPDDE